MPYTNETAERVCKQCAGFQTQLSVGRDCTAQFTQKLPIDIILQLRHYFHRRISTFIVQYKTNIFLKRKQKTVNYQFGNQVYAL